MLSPRESTTRERTSLDGLWRFAIDPAGAGRAERWWTSVLPGGREMAVPASFNDIVPTRAARNHVGDVWYQRTVRVPRGWDGQRIILRFDAATHRATAWVGDWGFFGERAEVGEQQGGAVGLQGELAAQRAQHHLELDVVPVGAQPRLAARVLGERGRP
jgi:beta-glucuronidase